MRCTECGKGPCRYSQMTNHPRKTTRETCMVDKVDEGFYFEKGLANEEEKEDK